ncbi:DUF3370 family protein [Micromonospora sp. NPDC051141]|uniref:DUF3370 family protein n=1 Tax=Micromonospora sp. NPDC051141 TaxID=3364284 RepID=UPI0037B47BDE
MWTVTPARHLLTFLAVLAVVIGLASAPVSAAEAIWRTGSAPGPGRTVPLDQVQQLPGGLSGAPVVVSNNPETVTGNGWLMLHSRATGRGGRAYPVTGDVPLYLYHQNGTGTTRYLHVLISNPGSTAIQVSGVGSMYTNDQVPLDPDPAARCGGGPSYRVARDWLDIERDWQSPRANVRFGILTVGPGKAVQAVVARMNPANLIDGRIRVTVVGGSAYLYTVMTSDGSATTAINYSQSNTSAAPGNIQPEVPSVGEPGRMAGVYANSVWSTGSATQVTVPAAPAYLGYGLDTIRYNRVDLDQSAAGVAYLSDSATRSYGNYGFRYRVGLAFSNPSSVTRTVRLSFGHGFAGSADNGETTWNGPVQVTDHLGTRTDILCTRPTAPRDPTALGTWTLAPAATETVTIELFIPGLIYSQAQLILESV